MNRFFSPPPRQIQFDRRRIQHEFKHASDFGIQGNWNTQNGIAFENALRRHVQDANVAQIPGTYRGRQQVIHYVEHQTHLWVATDLQGNFVAAWRLSPIQYHYLIQNNNVQ